MNRCERCAAIPAPLPDSGTLFLAPPIAHTSMTLRAAVAESGLAFTEPFANGLAIELPAGSLDRLVDALVKVLGPVELGDIRSLLLPEGDVPSIADLGRMQPLATLAARARSRWLHALIRDDRFVSHFQPIVHARDTGEVFAHECLLRGIGADGETIPPGRLYDAARAADLMFPLDRAARLCAIRSAVAAGITERIFINFNPTSVYDPAFCLRTTVAAVDQAGIDPGRVVFEVVESDESHPDLPRIVRFYRDAGFRIALDDLGAGFGSLNLLTELKPDFIKLDMQLARGVDGDPYKAHVLSRLIDMARDLGVGTVAEGIETTAEYEWFRDHGIDYIQGFLVARPGSPRRSPDGWTSSPCSPEPGGGGLWSLEVGGGGPMAEGRKRISEGRCREGCVRALTGV